MLQVKAVVALTSSKESALQARVAQAYIQACELDVVAIKPGNVSVVSPGHRMTHEDFLRSAVASVKAINAAQTSVGERIHHAIISTQQAVATNTNLGIVLLCAPIAHAVLDREATMPREDQRRRVAAVLEDLTVADADHAFQAIRLANPAGLGSSDQHDVRAAASVTLLEAMRVAAPRDSIARQYATGYADIWDAGVATLDRALHAGFSLPWATTAVFLSFLASYPDSHVQRKLGGPEAQALQQQALRFLGSDGWRGDLPETHASLQAWDADLKSRGINPGTSADLTVATLFMGLLR